MAGQPVKRGNWGDWAVIERTPRSEKRCCGGCIHYCYEDDSCKVRPIVVYEVGADFWKTCPQYCTKCHYIVKSQYIRYRSAQTNPLPQTSPTTSTPKAPIRYNPNPAIVVGMNVIDSEKKVGTVLSFDYSQNKIFVKYSSGVVEYQFPDVFINHQLKKYHIATDESLVIDYFSKASTVSNSVDYHVITSSTVPDESTILYRTALAQAKNVHNLEIHDFVCGMSVYHLRKGIGTIDSVRTSKNQISVHFKNRRSLFRIPLDFTNGNLALIGNRASFSSKQLRANLLAQIEPTALKIRDFKCGMEIADIKYGLGVIDKVIHSDKCIWISFSEWIDGCLHGTYCKCKVPDDFVNGRLKIVIE